MKKHYSYLFLFFLSILLSGCEVIGDIFKAGMWVGIIAVFIVGGIILWIVGKMRK